MCLSVYVCLSVSLSVCVCLSIYMCLSVYLSVLDHMLSTSEDDTKSLTHIVKVCLVFFDFLICFHCSVCHVLEFCCNLQLYDVTDRMLLYRMFFPSLNFMSSFLCTLKSKKTFSCNFVKDDFDAILCTIV